MSFARLVLKNLLRHRTRSSLTVLGISLGIMTVVALGVITDGLQTMAGHIARAGGADFIVGEKGSYDLTFSTVTDSELQAVAGRNDVAEAIGLLVVVRRLEANPYFVTIGIEPNHLDDVELEVRDGRALAPGATGEVMIGAEAAADLDLDVGETLSIETRSFTVVGIFKSGIYWQDKGAILPLTVLQEMDGRTGVVTFALIEVAPGADSAAVAADIEAQHPTLAAVSGAAEFSDLDQGMDLIDSANLVISLLAVVIGAIGVTNTMVMAVFERTQEIGVLRAVGWSGARILRMIMSESLILCALATGIGVVLGIAASELVVHGTMAGGLLVPSYQTGTFVQAVLVAVGVALIGAAYPSYRAVRLAPMEALRHE
jgi:putative ABC transport system permease protein